MHIGPFGRRTLLGVFVAAALAAIPAASAQTKSTRLVVGFAPGGPIEELRHGWRFGFGFAWVSTRSGGHFQLRCGPNIERRAFGDQVLWSPRNHPAEMAPGPAFSMPVPQAFCHLAGSGHRLSGA
jgi:hypothetical protein